MTIKYSNWPALETSERVWDLAEDSGRREAVRKRCADAVHAALEKIPERELQVVRQHHFEGRTFAQIAAETLTDTQTVNNQYHRALRRLKKLLTEFARAEFGLEPERVTCAICNSPARAEIDKLLAERKPGASLGPLIRKIRSRFGVSLVSPMTIVAHLKYHS